MRASTEATRAAARGAAAPVRIDDMVAELDDDAEVDATAARAEAAAATATAIAAVAREAVEVSDIYETFLCAQSESII